MFEQCQMRRRKWYVGMIGILLALVVKIPDLWADVDEMAQLLVERLPEHATERYHHPDISPNGDKVAFSVSTHEGNKSVIWVYDIPSGEMLQLTEPDTNSHIGDVHVQWAPDGRTIAFVSDRSGENHIYLVSSTGGDVQRISIQALRDGTGPWVCRFSWSPDGEHIAFSDSDDEGVDLFTIRLKDNTIEQLTNHPGIEQYPNWSDDGASIIYVGDQSGLDEFWIYDLATGTESKVPMDAISGIAYPVLSPDGEWIVFMAPGILGLSSFVVSINGGPVRKVAPGDKYVNWGPVWDPDGDHLIYHAVERFDTPLVVRDLASGQSELLLDSLVPLGLLWASWSSDNRYLAFTQIIQSAPGIVDTALYIAEPEIADVRRLVKTVANRSFFKRQAPAWTRDMKSIFAVVPQGAHTQLVLIELNGGEQRLLTTAPTFKSEVAISPDGELLVYVARVANKEDLWIYDLITDEELQLTFSGDVKFEPVFSPDGNSIAFVGGSGMHLFTVPTDGGEVVQHTRDRGWDFHPQWIDNDSFYYSSGIGDRSVQLVTLDPSERRLLYGVEGVNIYFPFISRDRRYLYFVYRWSRDLRQVDLDTGVAKVVIDDRLSRPQFSPDGSKVAYIRQEAQAYATIWRHNIEQIIEKTELP